MFKRCVLCGASAKSSGFCGPCWFDLPFYKPRGLNRVPAFCQEQFIAFDFVFPINKLIHRFKFKRDLAALNACAAALKEIFCKHLLTYSAIIPVPLGAERYLERGFNQASFLANTLGSGPGTPVLHRALKTQRGRKPVPQHSLNTRQARRRNVAGYFKSTPEIRVLSGRILLVDDVITSGATISEAAKALKVETSLPIDVVALAAPTDFFG